MWFVQGTACLGPDCPEVSPGGLPNRRPGTSIASRSGDGFSTLTLAQGRQDSTWWMGLGLRGLGFRSLGATGASDFPSRLNAGMHDIRSRVFWNTQGFGVYCTA